jgi:recombinational DNA repair protein RecR
MVIEKDSDLESVKKSRVYHGKYFILGGLVPVVEKTTKSRVRIEELKNKISSQKDLKEVITIMGFKDDAEFFDWLDNVLSKSGINQVIIKKLANQKLPLLDIAVESLESSNIRSNPRFITDNQVIKIISKSLKIFNVN